MSNEVATTMKKSQEVQAYVNDVKEALKAYAQRSYDPALFAKSVQLCILENKGLMDALRTKEGQSSLFHALRFAATTGLSLNPQEGKAALIPYKNKIQYQVMKNGMLDVALADEKVEAIMSATVHENDEFTIKQTMTGDTYEFVPDRKERGDIDGFFAAVLLKSGRSHVKYMTKAQVEEHRDKYSQAKTGAAWANSFGPMGEKTVIKALLRTVKISSDLDIIVGTDDKAEADIIDITPKPSLEEQVTEAPVEEFCGACGETDVSLYKQENGDILCQGCIDVCTMNSEQPDEPTEPEETGDSDLIEPPSEKGDISGKQMWAIKRALLPPDIDPTEIANDDPGICTTVSKRLGYNAPIQNLNCLDKSVASGLIKKLKEAK